MSNEQSRLLDRDLLRRDGHLGEPLRRVNHSFGVMIGVDASRDEQGYHQRRLTRHQYWLQGFGTVVGMRVGQRLSDGRLILDVAPGVGIDGLGREVLIHERHCLDLRQWIEDRESTRPGIIDAARDGGANRLVLAVLARSEACAADLTPTVGAMTNQATDAVTHGRVVDSASLRLAPLAEHVTPDSRWGLHGLAPLLPGDQERIDNPAPLSAPAVEARLRRLNLFADADHLGTGVPEEELVNRAEILLASVTVAFQFSADPRGLPANFENTVAIDNLVRPFVPLPE